MRHRYQVGPDPAVWAFMKARREDCYETFEEAIAVAAIHSLQGYMPQHFVIDRVTRKAVGAAELARACDILAGKQLAPGDIPTFTDESGNIHMGIRS